MKQIYIRFQNKEEEKLGDLFKAYCILKGKSIHNELIEIFKEKTKKIKS